MKKYIVTIILLVFVILLCASTVFLTFDIVSIAKSNAEIIKKTHEEKFLLQNEINELKGRIYEQNIEMPDIFDEKLLLTDVDIMTIVDSNEFNQVYQGDIIKMKDITVMEYVCNNGYMFVYLTDTSGASVVSDIIFYDYNWRRYIVDTLLIPMHEQGLLGVPDTTNFFGEAKETSPIRYDKYIGYQWSLGDGFSYFAEADGVIIVNSMLVCPDGTIIDLVIKKS